MQAATCSLGRLYLPILTDNQTARSAVPADPSREPSVDFVCSVAPFRDSLALWPRSLTSIPELVPRASAGLSRAERFPRRRRGAPGAFAPFVDFGVMGASSTRSRRSGGTDSTSFNEAGLPGIGLSQDPIEYGSHTWHTNLDTYERIVEDDVQKSAIAIAAAVYHVAMRDEMLPRFSKEEMPAPGGQRHGKGHHIGGVAHEQLFYGGEPEHPLSSWSVPAPA